MKTKPSKIQILLPIITLIIGLVVGYFIPGLQDNDVSITRTNYHLSNNFTKDQFLHSIRISHDTAVAMINRYRNQNDKAFFRRLRTDDGSSLHGFWIPQSILNDILNQPKVAVNGLRIYLGKRYDVDKHKRIFTLILLGTSGPVNNFLGADGNTDLSGDDNPIYDHVDPCPTSCGTLVP